MPAQILFNLCIDRKQKVLIGIIFSVGSGSANSILHEHAILTADYLHSVMIISIVRIIYVYQYVGEIDVTYYQAAAALYSTAELNIGVICTSVVGLKPFIQACRGFIHASWASAKEYRSKTNPLLTDDDSIRLEACPIVSHCDVKSEASNGKYGNVVS